jgi:hypothetical protein
MKTETTRSSELLVHISQTTRHHVPQRHNLNTHCHENPKCHTNNCSYDDSFLRNLLKFNLGVT